MIPAVFHFIWLGPAPFPEPCRAWVASWKRYHPAWSTVLWTDRSRPVEDLFDATQSLPMDMVTAHFYRQVGAYVGDRAVWAARSDILRMEIICRYGGVYLDADVEAFAPIDDLLGNVRLFVADEFGPCPGNFMFGATANHPALWNAIRGLDEQVCRCYTWARRWWWRGRRVPAWLGRLLGGERSLPAPTAGPAIVSPIDLTGPRYLNRVLRAHADCVVFPSQLFNPLPSRADGGAVDVWPANARANHHYLGGWYDQVKRPPPGRFKAAE